MLSYFDVPDPAAGSNDNRVIPGSKTVFQRDSRRLAWSTIPAISGGTPRQASGRALRHCPHRIGRRTASAGWRLFATDGQNSSPPHPFLLDKNGAGLPFGRGPLVARAFASPFG